MKKRLFNEIADGLRPLFAKWPPRFLTYLFAMLAALAFLTGSDGLTSGIKPELRYAFESVTRGIGAALLHVVVEFLTGIRPKSDSPEQDSAFVKGITLITGFLSFILFFTAAVRFWILLDSSI